MKEALRIVFMGTPEFAVETLKTLIENKYNVVGVITAPDKPAGRGQKLHESDVKKYSASQNLNILQPNNLKDEKFIAELKSLNANLQIVVAFRMLPEVIWKMPEFGTFNLHASLLPDYRGAAPIHWAIINGETKTGVTTFFIDEKIDTGAIILQEEIEIGLDETVGFLHDRLMNLGSQLVLKTVEWIERENVVTMVQPKLGIEKTAHKLNKENCKIDWNQPLNLVYDKIRGLNPFPSAWCYLENGKDVLSVKLYDIEKEQENHEKTYGNIEITKDSLRVAVKNGYIIIKEIQFPSKRKMDVKSLVNGYEFIEGAKLF